MNENWSEIQPIDVVIPAFNEEQSIGKVIQDIPKELVRHIVVANNNSTDQTKQVALAQGAVVTDQPTPGYGATCQKAIGYLNSLEKPPKTVVFLDGDYADYPQQMPEVVAPIANKKAELVIGSRALGTAQQGSLTFPQRFGNALAGKMIQVLYGVKMTDLGPFRAIKWSTLQALQMEDMNYGWTAEMQVKAAKKKIPYTEVPVDYKVRIGTSKVSGTVKGTVMAGYKIIWTILNYAVR